jgi:CRISPR-associated protein Csd1
VLIGFDKEAFCSYGLTQSANAAVSEQGAAAYRAALNDLIRQKGQRIAGAMIVHWFSRRVEPQDDPLSWLEESMEQQALKAESLASKFLRSVHTGEQVDLTGNYYYAMILSGASGRVMVRDWAEGSFDDLGRNVAQWFNDLSIVNRYGDGLASYPKFAAVLGALVRDFGDLTSPTVGKIWRVAMRGEEIPLSALAQTVRRATVDVIGDQPANHARYGLMKAFYLRSKRQKGADVIENSLNPHLNNKLAEPAYHCGRLMALMAEIQRRALGDIGAGLVQRYYAAASATPALVLGRLSRLSQFHLGKLEPGLARWYETELASVWASLDDGIPQTLSLQEQSLFALGYYQQIAQMRGHRVDQKEEQQS